MNKSRAIFNIASSAALATVAIVGRPNVGKSTLFNRLVGRREALVHDMPGVTRDRLYGRSDWIGRDFAVIDTGGFDPERRDGVWKEMQWQVRVAIEEADAIIYILDGPGGITSTDEEITDYLRKNAQVPVLYTVNKIDGPSREGLVSEFWRLGPDELYPISAEHGLGVGDLLDALVDNLPVAEEPPPEMLSGAIPVAVIGRPNVGKSTLINKMLGTERLLTHETPGTTRDAVDTLVEWEGKSYLFIDTAGIRRRSQVSHRLEKFAVIKALQAIERCDVALVMVDATMGVMDQEARIAGYALQRGKAAVILLNKWDLMEKETMTFDTMVLDLKEKLHHVNYAPVISISAKTGQRIDRIMEAIDKVDEQHARRVPTPELNKAFEKAIGRHKPPVAGTKRVKFYYITQYGVRPPKFAIITNLPDKVPVAYRRYLSNQLREAFGFEGTPIRIGFRPRKGRRTYKK